MPSKDRQKVIAVDVDGTLCEYDGWKGPAYIGKPFPKVVEVLKKLKERGWLIVIWTTRKADSVLRRHLQKYDVPFDYINKNPKGPRLGSPKLFADIYWDDRAYRFCGEHEIGQIDTFVECLERQQPWFEKEKPNADVK